MDGWPSTGITRVGGCTLSGGQVQLCSNTKNCPNHFWQFFHFFSMKEDSFDGDTSQKEVWQSDPVLLSESSLLCVCFMFGQQ